MKIVIDTNIIFSCLLNPNNNISNLIFETDSTFQFYSCNYLKYEIQKHWEKILKISKSSPVELFDNQFEIFNKIYFINEEIIPKDIWNLSEQLVSGIDENDIAFVALSHFLDAKLWTGDKVLYSGLKEKGFDQVLNTLEISILKNELLNA